MGRAICVVASWSVESDVSVDNPRLLALSLHPALPRGLTTATWTIRAFLRCLFIGGFRADCPHSPPTRRRFLFLRRRPERLRLARWLVMGRGWVGDCCSGPELVPAPMRERGCAGAVGLSILLCLSLAGCAGGNEAKPPAAGGGEAPA